MNRSEQINELATAMAKAQGAIKGAVRDSTNPFFKSDYADLSSVWDACREQLSGNGISVIQMPCDAESGVGIETILMHSGGQWMSQMFSMPVLKKDAQGVGSALTYARRYALAAFVGIAPLDDDGNAAIKSADHKLSEKKFIDFKTQIEATQTKEDAKKVAVSAGKVCEECKDLESYGKIKEVLKKHCTMIDSVAKAKAKEEAHV